MKELLHFTMDNSIVCEQMVPVISSLLDKNPDIKYTKINVNDDKSLYLYYSKKYSMPACPAFIGLVDGVVQDGHVGFATELILESLVN